MDQLLSIAPLLAVVALLVLTYWIYGALEGIRQVLAVGLGQIQQTQNEHLSSLARELKPLKTFGTFDCGDLSDEEMEKRLGYNTLGGQLVVALNRLEGSVGVIRAALEKGTLHSGVHAEGPHDSGNPSR